jgi:hypothetical protein
MEGRCAIPDGEAVCSASPPTAGSGHLPNLKRKKNMKTKVKLKQLKTN